MTFYHPIIMWMIYEQKEEIKPHRDIHTHILYANRSVLELRRMSLLADGCGFFSLLKMKWRFHYHQHHVKML